VLSTKCIYAYQQIDFPRFALNRQFHQSPVTSTHSRERTGRGELTSIRFLRSHLVICFVFLVSFLLAYLHFTLLALAFLLKFLSLCFTCSEASFFLFSLLSSHLLGSFPIFFFLCCRVRRYSRDHRGTLNKPIS
jgi:hypothetical protein